MVSASRVRRSLTAVLASLSLAATVLFPTAGVASAASTSTTCPSGEGTVCYLKISGPESVLTGVPFTVQVLVTTDGSTLAKSDPCASKVAVQLTVFRDFGESTSSTVYVANASAAVATFTVTIPSGPENDGPYTLTATAPPATDAAAPATSCDSYFYVSDSRGITAVTVPETQPIAPCPDNVSCAQTTNTGTGGGSAATLIADDGVFDPVAWVPPDSAARSACGAPADTTANSMLRFDSTATGTKTIIFALAAIYVNKGIGQFNVCWTSNTPFVPLGGGTPVTTGLLPACAKNATGPCVLFKKSNRRNVGFFGVLAPIADPGGYAK